MHNSRYTLASLWSKEHPAFNRSEAGLTTNTNDHHSASNTTSTMRKRPTYASKC
ncbi:hypothetical protein CY34DRAFT_19340 [Suillus luteus UH-Slu-Lm8-n1]|uniref:Uncharacterized protein n=1 Tax=Suillus luteus UH-Slu-Lm8-n1 TaxID=930992 RepID=A0A0C9Z3U9_9AGAM|nr:hypothetical protein CY34DRAFT_19340 [Suillus luteus UH-Slu-Lm8-n1]